jgi:hypothetical protein
MKKKFILTLLLGAAPVVYGATGSLTIFDDADENGFNHAAAICTGTALFGETSVVHSGAAAVGIQKTDNNGAGWAAPTTYSAQSDYDGISFWFNAGAQETTLTSLAIYDGDDTAHFLHLEDAYGGHLPANTWIQFQIPFASPLFAMAESSSPTTIQTVCVINHSGGTGSQSLYLDDIALTGADIFKDGFQ